jgi:hypothetical protein
MIATIADGKNARFSIGECLLARSALKTIAAGVDGASGLRS